MSAASDQTEEALLAELPLEAVVELAIEAFRADTAECLRLVALLDEREAARTT